MHFVSNMAAPIMWKNKLTKTVARGLELTWLCCLLQMLMGVACDQYDEFEGFLLCRKCGCEIAKAEDLISMPSNLALRQRNDTISGSKKILVQLFKNPQGMYFELITSSDAEVEKANERYATDSWFPGYTWSISKCPRCGAHVGWSFGALTGSLEAAQSKISSFVGLILDKIMHEEDINNLIAIPKTYAS